MFRLAALGLFLVVVLVVGSSAEARYIDADSVLPRAGG